MLYNPQLETFVRVADAGSFSKASEQLFITPSAIIKQINLLENDLGLSLFVRSHKGIALTEEGKSLYDDAKYLIQYAKDSIVRAKSSACESEIIRIGTSPVTPTSFLVELWPKLHDVCPEIKFKLVVFENTPENARGILQNLGTNIDIVSGLFDENLQQIRGCTALELQREPIRCAVSINHPLAKKETLQITDLFGNDFMIIRRNWNRYVDVLRDDILENHKEINVIDFPFYDVNVFNQCEHSNQILLTTDTWADIHPLLKIIPVEWDYAIPFGILHALQPSKTVQRFLDAVQMVLEI